MVRWTCSVLALVGNRLEIICISPEAFSNEIRKITLHEIQQSLFDNFTIIERDVFIFKLYRCNSQEMIAA
jgi:hypothetical protein